MKECKIINDPFCYLLEVDDKQIIFHGGFAVEYFKDHYEKLGYKVIEIDKRNHWLKNKEG